MGAFLDSEDVRANPRVRRERGRTLPQHCRDVRRRCALHRGPLPARGPARGHRDQPGSDQPDQRGQAAEGVGRQRQCHWRAGRPRGPQRRRMYLAGDDHRLRHRADLVGDLPGREPAWPGRRRAHAQRRVHGGLRRARRGRAHDPQGHRGAGRAEDPAARRHVPAQRDGPARLPGRARDLVHAEREPASPEPWRGVPRGVHAHPQRDPEGDRVRPGRERQAGDDRQVPASRQAGRAEDRRCGSPGGLATATALAAAREHGGTPSPASR